MYGEGQISQARIGNEGCGRRRPLQRQLEKRDGVPNCRDQLTKDKDVSQNAKEEKIGGEMLLLFEA